MKNIFLVGLFAMIFATNSYSQKSNSFSDNYSVGIGYGFNSNIGNPGILFSNDYKFNLSTKFALNPGISFFQSLDVYEKRRGNDYRSHSGIVLDFSVEYAIAKIKNVTIALNVGPSFEIGDYSYVKIQANEQFNIPEKIVSEQIYQPGVHGGVEFIWKNKSMKTRAISFVTNSQYYLVPNSLGVLYKFGL
jgi:hypothetical protein